MRIFGLAIALLACGAPSFSRPPTTAGAAAAPRPSSDASYAKHATRAAVSPARPEQWPSATLRIATFNIQVFGRTKVSKPGVMAQLVTIIRKYDVIAVQEIMDSSGSAPKRLLEAINVGSTRTYGMLLSPRTGLQANDRTFQEQYAVLYDTALVEALPGSRVFDDAGQDLFQREPYVARLRARRGGFSFVLIAIHTSPTSAVIELGALHEVVEWARVEHPDEDDFVVLGDFNAGCDYATRAELVATGRDGDQFRRFHRVPMSPGKPRRGGRGGVQATIGPRASVRVRS